MLTSSYDFLDGQSGDRGDVGHWKDNPLADILDGKSGCMVGVGYGSGYYGSDSGLVCGTDSLLSFEHSSNRDVCSSTQTWTRIGGDGGDGGSRGGIDRAKNLCPRGGR